MGFCQHRTTQDCSHPALGTGQSGIAEVSPCTRPVVGTGVGTHCPWSVTCGDLLWAQMWAWASGKFNLLVL